MRAMLTIPHGSKLWQCTVCWPWRTGSWRSAPVASLTTRRAGRHIAMLVLTRKSNQSIMIGDDIEVSVLAIMGEKVRIGIQAPRDIPVFRKEVYLEIQDERLGSGKGAARGGRRGAAWPGRGHLTTVRSAAARGRRPGALAEQVVQRCEHRHRHDRPPSRSACARAARNEPSCVLLALRRRCACARTRCRRRCSSRLRSS